MIRRLLFINLVLALLLAGFWLVGLPDPEPPAPIMPSFDVQHERFTPALAASGMQETEQRPLFWMSRRPLPPSQTDAATDSGPSPDGMVGLVQGGDGDAVVLFREEDRVLRLRPGQSAGGWRLDRIDEGQVYLVGPEGQSRRYALPRHDATSSSVHTITSTP